MRNFKGEKVLMKKNSATVLIKEIASKAGVSQSTVSIVLNGRSEEMRISKKTQELVLEIAKEMDYHPNIYARRLRNAADSGIKHMVLVLWNKKLLGDEMARFFEGAFECIEENNYGVELVIRAFEEDNIKKHLNVLNSQNYNGIIVSGATKADVDFLESESFDIPVVMTSRIGKALSSVSVDNYSVGRQCAKLFADAGYKKAGIVTTHKPSVGSNLRVVGFKEACEEYGIEIKPEWEMATDEFDVSANEDDFSKFLKQKDLPNCLFVQRSMMALGIMNAIQRKGMKIPEDMAILGCGLNSFLGRNKPSLSMVGGSLKSYGTASLNLLMMMINNRITTPMNTITPPVFEYNTSFVPKQ